MSEYDQMVRDAILSHYMRQSGSGATIYPVFRGSPVQYGNGIGDIFRSIGRFLMPIFSSSAKTFVQSTAKGMESGQSLTEAAKQALKPSLATGVQQAGETLVKKIAGGGRKGLKRKASHKKKPLVYKGGAKRAIKRKASKFTFVPINF